jgi:hypothetical protein
MKRKLTEQENDKVRKLTEQELIESRLSDAKAKHPELEQYIDVFAEKDPSGGKQKYLQWMVKQLSQQEASPETAQKILDAVKLYHKNIQRLEKKDINQYKTVQDLVNDVSSLGKSQTTKRKEKKEQAMEGSEIVLDDGDFFIVRPFTEQASCYYGKQTRWCISAAESENYFERYSKEGHAFYFLRNNHLGAEDDGKKIAFVFDESGNLVEYFDAPDDSISRGDVENHILRNFVQSNKPEFQQMEEEGTLENHADEVLETLEDLMGEHLEKNPVDTSEYGPSEDDYQEIADEHNRQAKFTSMELGQVYGSDGFYYDGFGRFSVDLNEEPEDEEEIEDFVRNTLEENRVYPDELQIEIQDNRTRGLDLEVFMQFREEYDYSLDNMQAMSNYLLEMEDGIAEAKKATEKFLMSKGYIDKPEEPKKEPEPGDQLEMFESALLAKPSQNTDQLIEAITRRLQKIVK